MKGEGLSVEAWIALPDEIGDFESPEPAEDYYRKHFRVVDGRKVSLRLDAVLLRWLREKRRRR